MTIVKIYCDICRKEVPTHGDIEEIILDTKSGMKCRYEVCSDCYGKICKHIEQMKQNH